MSQIKKLENYLKEKLLQFEINGEILTIAEKDYYIVTDDSNVFEIQIPEKYGIEEYIYEFGGRWYFQQVGKDLTLTEVKYIGSAVQKLPINSFLGMHSGYELMNGIGIYKEWVKKAKFLGVKTLGICEKSSLSGVFSFQAECKKNGIKPVIGMEVPVINSIGKTFFIKAYSRDFQGWLNLLKFNTILNIDKKNHIEEEFINQNNEGLYIVVDPKTTDFEYYPKIAHFYQLDTVRFLNEEKDIWYLSNLEKFILNKEIEPIAIYDAYYLEINDVATREALWGISKEYDDRTNNQFFKNKDQYVSELISMFEKGNQSWIKLYKVASSNEKIVSENCNYTYDTDTRHLPKYKMTNEEIEKFGTSDKMFLHLVTKGFAEKKFKNAKKYLDRLKLEVDVLRQGDVIDYFLSLYDIIQFSKREKMLIGIGRGSAGGSLVAYLLDIIKINPLEFDLLFERFLNSGRMGLWEDRPLYSLQMEDGSIVKLQEGTIVKVKRKGKVRTVIIHEVLEEDELIIY